MNVLLIRPNPTGNHGLQSVMICEPLELMYLASVKENGHVVDILDMIIEKASRTFH